MKSALAYILGVILLVAWSNYNLAQEIKLGNAKSWSVSGLVQVQHLVSPDINSDTSETNNGFRIRTGRLHVKSKLTDFVSARFLIEGRDNNPRLLDAEGMLVFNDFFLKFGQFKVPVWREELRLAGNLLLVERSPAAAFLAGSDILLSSRHMGMEFGGKIQKNVDFAINYSNGSGLGVSEDAGRSKEFNVNNGKLFTGRINVAAKEILQVALSVAANQLGNNINGADTSGIIYAIAPDFGIYLDSNLDIEGGIAFGSISRGLLKTRGDRKFIVSNLTGRWRSEFSQPKNHLAGCSGVEFAAGITYVEPNSNLDVDETIYFRLGPALNFGKHARIQFNGEVEQPTAKGADSMFFVRSQATFNF
jgi:hypothetical protein